jgi:hypothetical protein
MRKRYQGVHQAASASRQEMTDAWLGALSIQPRHDLSSPVLHGVIMVVEVDVSRAKPVSSHKLVVARWSLVFGVARQHALNAHAYALDVLDRAPTLGAE